MAALQSKSKCSTKTKVTIGIFHKQQTQSEMIMKCLHFLASQSRCVHSMRQLTPVNDQAYPSSMRGFQLLCQNSKVPPPSIRPIQSVFV